MAETETIEMVSMKEANDDDNEREKPKEKAKVGFDTGTATNSKVTQTFQIPPKEQKLREDVDASSPSGSLPITVSLTAVSFSPGTEFSESFFFFFSSLFSLLLSLLSSLFYLTVCCAKRRSSRGRGESDGGF